MREGGWAVLEKQRAQDNCDNTEGEREKKERAISALFQCQKVTEATRKKEERKGARACVRACGF